jgi:protein with PEP-CTERM/exosortase system signal
MKFPIKVNRISTKKLAILSAAFCAVMLAFSPNAKAVTVLNFNDGHTLGRVFSGEGPVAQRTALVNHMIGMALSTSNRFSGHVVFRDGNNFGPLPGPAVFALTGHGTNITIGSGTYSYLLAQYGTEIDSVGQAWYIGNLSGDITIPATTGTMRLTRWKLFGPGVPGVPDGGTTVMLLGAALVALGMAQRFLKI